MRMHTLLCLSLFAKGLTQVNAVSLWINDGIESPTSELLAMRVANRRCVAASPHADSFRRNTANLIGQMASTDLRIAFNGTLLHAWHYKGFSSYSHAKFTRGKQCSTSLGNGRPTGPSSKLATKWQYKIWSCRNILNVCKSRRDRSKC